MKAASSVPLPSDSEGPRARLALLGTAWVMASYMHTANPLVKGARPFVFTAYADYLLGELVWGLTAKGSDERQIAHPCWVFRDAVGKRPANDIASETRRETERKKGKGKPKGVGKGKGVERRAGDGKPKGKGKGKPESCAPVTPDGERICFHLNNKERKCQHGQKCKFAHVCGRCFRKNTPLYECNHQGAREAHRLRNVRLRPGGIRGKADVSVGRDVRPARAGTHELSLGGRVRRPDSKTVGGGDG